MTEYEESLLRKFMNKNEKYMLYEFRQRYFYSSRTLQFKSIFNSICFLADQEYA
jgi:hypothetical protein